MIRFSVVIPTYQRLDDLARCLDQLAPGEQTLSFGEYEVIVTDDEGEGSKTQALVEEQYPWAKWVAGPGRGPAANRNEGSSYAQGEWLVFTDDDCIPEAEWLEAYAEAASGNPSLEIMEGATVSEEPRKSLAWQAPINTEGGRLWSCNIAARADCFSALGGFDTDYPFALEDMDFKTRVLKREIPWAFVREAAVVHPWRYGTARQLFTRQMRELKGWRVLANKHPEAIRQFRVGYLYSPFQRALDDFQSKNNSNSGVKEYIGFFAGGVIKSIFIVWAKYTGIY